MIDSTLLNLIYNIYARYHSKSIVKNNYFFAFFNFPWIIPIIKRNNITNRYNLWEIINIKLNKVISFNNIKENNNNNRKKGLIKNLYLFDLIVIKSKKVRLYGSKRKINKKWSLFSYYEFIIWRNRPIFLIRCAMFAYLLSKIIIQIKNN